MRNTRSFAISGLGTVFAAAMAATALTPMPACAADVESDGLSPYLVLST